MEIAANLKWWWLSFADNHGFLGAVTIQADSMTAAVVAVTGLGANPGGEVQIYQAPDAQGLTPGKLYNKAMLIDAGLKLVRVQ